jgi:hypothetical protein
MNSGGESKKMAEFEVKDKMREGMDNNKRDNERKKIQWE